MLQVILLGLFMWIEVGKTYDFTGIYFDTSWSRFINSLFFRTSMLEVVRQDYMLRTARERLQSEKTVILSYALKNAIYRRLHCLCSELPGLFSELIIEI